MGALLTWLSVWMPFIRWVVGMWHWVASILHRPTKKPQSQDKSKIRVDKTFSQIRIFGISIYSKEDGTKHEYSLIKTLPELSIQENTDPKEEQLLKNKKTSASSKKAKKAKKEFKDDIASLEKAAEKGDVEAQFYLALDYYEGKGVEENFEKAFRWWHELAEKGQAAAQYNLGVMYYNGQGVLESYEQATICWRKAAEQGHATAQYNLGYMYYACKGVEKNLSMAYGLWLLAAKGGDEIARGGLQRVKPTLTAEQITEGQKIAQEWQARIDANSNKEE